MAGAPGAENGAGVASFSPADVERAARELAAKPYNDAADKVPASLAAMTGEQWNGVRFRPEHSLWRGDSARFEVRPQYPGYIYNRLVAINVVDGGRCERLAFSPGMFAYPENFPAEQAAATHAEAGFAGFSLYYPLNADSGLDGRSDKDEVAVFLGATQFQAAGKNSRLGVMARGVALGAASPDGEEFPFFREFWLVKPAPEDDKAVVYALMDSPSMTGAFSFVVAPGLSTVMNVDAKFFRRQGADPARKMGLAPLTSMFLHSETQNGKPGDYRPEVHNSDGLLCRFEGDSWSWLPLENPERLTVSAVAMNNPRGFGLLQRDDDFDHYQDLTARFDRRPSLWVEPAGNWGAGRIELLEIPCAEDYQGNIVAYWVPEDSGKAGAPPDAGAATGKNAPGQPDLRCAYRLYWMAPGVTPHKLGRVSATRVMRAPAGEATRVIVDFEGEELNSLPADTGLTSMVEFPESIQPLEKSLVKNPVTGGWRLTLAFRLPKKGVVESLIPSRDAPPPLRISALLKKGDNLPDALTETCVLDIAQ